MEHHLQRHLSPSQTQEEDLMISPDFFVDVDQLRFHDADVSGAAAGGVVVDDGASWMEDLMQLGDELLFGAGGTGEDDREAVVDAMADDGRRYQLEAWYDDERRLQQEEYELGSPEQPCSYDDVISPGGSGDHHQGRAGEHHPDDNGDLSATRKRRDRSKTIVSERKRRFRMKEKLYELRSLVPNITKMDKASIIADAVEYVKNLQTHARKLKEDVAALEARPGLPRRMQQQQQQQDRRRQAGGGRGNDEGISRPRGGGGGGGARVASVGAAQVGDGLFFVTVECERRDGVAAPLCAAVESLACFRVQSSTLGCSSDRVVSTLTLKVSEAGEDMAINERTVKLWVLAALLKEGFRPEASTAEIC